jgi:hypothetical protein
MASGSQGLLASIEEMGRVYTPPEILLGERDADLGANVRMAKLQAYSGNNCEDGSGMMNRHVSLFIPHRAPLILNRSGQCLLHRPPKMNELRVFRSVRRRHSQSTF